MKKVSIENLDDHLVLERLQALGVTLLIDWDALVFLYSHAASLGTAAQIARFVGCDKAEIGGTLRRLEALGLIQRSRDSQGIRLYQFLLPSDDVRRSCLLELMSMTRIRKGRLMLLKHLKSPLHEPRRRRDSGLRLA